MEPTTHPLGGVVTRTVFGGAHGQGDRPALVDLGDGAVLSYRELVGTVVGAACGLLRRGARPGQVAGVLVDGVAAQLTALHTVIAAGGVALPLGAADAAALLRWDARLLFTTQKLAPAAVEAADRSRVRQVVSFGPAVDAIEFGALPTLEPVPLPCPSEGVVLITEKGRLTAEEFLAGMARLDDGIGLTGSDVLLVTWPPGADAELALLASLAFSRGALVVAGPGLPTVESPGPLRDFGVTVTAILDGRDRRVTRRVGERSI
ncbi:hypothetical protein Aph01nite_52850 [Acrocarpospora phusangensis]|uniref:AMP-dependent synthetase/ligase domain-containing protein n=1 Tax=Acrocarpospora phusangensis TaxID=1070424 RepID=A0A919UT07_9ACTN|nr:AMP-binding protein [Acrocarpospora phusangensis]GIH26975.1 hypothetical protein Aph01nite_52850 [Acrocarpospora phusangensis]